MSDSYFSLNSQIENKAPLNNLTSHISTSYIKWETRNGKWETRSGKWEIRNLEVGYGKGLNWAPRNGKWEPNQNSRLWRFALRYIIRPHIVTNGPSEWVLKASAWSQSQHFLARFYQTEEEDNVPGGDDELNSRRNRMWHAVGIEVCTYYSAWDDIILRERLYGQFWPPILGSAGPNAQDNTQ